MPENEIVKIARIYKDVFGSENGKAVLADLTHRCFGKVTTFNKDPYIHSYQEGCRHVLLTIQNLVDMDEKQIKELIADASSQEG